MATVLFDATAGIAGMSSPPTRMNRAASYPPSHLIPVERLVSAVAYGLCFVWRLILSMIGILGGGVSINDKSRQVSFPTTPGNYEVVRKYQSDQYAPFRFVLCYFDAVEFAFLGESFPSGPFTLD